jgi:hypothetical protein
MFTHFPLSLNVPCVLSEAVSSRPRQLTITTSGEFYTGMVLVTINTALGTSPEK